MSQLHRRGEHMTISPSSAAPSPGRRGNLPPGLRIGDVGDMGAILIRNEPGNGIVPEVAPAEVSSVQLRRRRMGRRQDGRGACLPACLRARMQASGACTKRHWGIPVWLLPLPTA